MMEEAIASAELTEPFEAPKDKDLTALNQLVEDYTNKETELMKVENELATRDEQFANFIVTQKRLAEQKAVLTDMIKDEMRKRGLTEHETDTVVLKLTPLGKYKTDDIEAVADELCDVVKKLNNKKVKAYVELNGKLPEGVESLGDRLVIKVKEN